MIVVWRDYTGGLYWHQFAPGDVDIDVQQEYETTEVEPWNSMYPVRFAIDAKATITNFTNVPIEGRLEKVVDGKTVIHFNEPVWIKSEMILRP